MQLGIDRILSDRTLRKPLKSKKLGLLAHPASLNSTLVASADALRELEDLKLTALFGPQHGIRGDKQYNMIESEDFKDKRTGLPVYSLYSHTRRPTPDMLKNIDVLLVDLQDVGVRIYTYVATLFYVLEECSKHNKEVWVLDRPNPIGRPIEGSLLRKGWESFVGVSPIPLRHGLTLAELAKFFVKKHKLSCELKVIPMEGYNPLRKPGMGWPEELSWVNPSPNIPSLSTARCYPGTILLEGTSLSDGRGTTHPLQIFGAPDFPSFEVLKEMARTQPLWMQGCRLRPCFFEPTFYKYNGKLCSGIEIHVDGAGYEHENFKPLRLMLLLLKSLRKLKWEGWTWRDPPYEYEQKRRPIDLICGGTELPMWVDDPKSTPQDLEKLLRQDEKAWEEEREEFLLYAGRAS